MRVELLDASCVLSAANEADTATLDLLVVLSRAFIKG
jgi:hypothetical protein